MNVEVKPIGQCAIRDEITTQALQPDALGPSSPWLALHLAYKIRACRSHVAMEFNSAMRKEVSRQA